MENEDYWIQSKICFLFSMQKKGRKDWDPWVYTCLSARQFFQAWFSTLSVDVLESTFREYEFWEELFVEQGMFVCSQKRRTFWIQFISVLRKVLWKEILQDSALLRSDVSPSENPVASTITYHWGSSVPNICCIHLSSNDMHFDWPLQQAMWQTITGVSFSFLPQTPVT